MRYCILLVSLILMPLVQADNTVVIAEMYDRHAPFVQADLNQAYQLAGLDVEFAVVPNNRAVIMASRGNYAALDLRHEGAPGLENLIKVPVQLYSIDSIYVWSSVDEDANNAEQTLLSADDLNDLQFVALEGSTFNGELEAMGLTPYYVDNIETAIRLATNERAALLLLSDGFVQTIKADGIELPLEKISEPLTQHVFYHWVHESHADWIPKLTESFEALKKQGVFLPR